MTRRAVRVNSQLQSNKRFANAFPKYCKLVDSARLYCTDAVGGPPKVKTGATFFACDWFYTLLLLVLKLKCHKYVLS